jgi:hypothetical protein
MPGSVLVIGAHPDDVEFASGGTLVRWIGEEWSAAWWAALMVARAVTTQAIKPAALAARRQEEQRAAARVLGVAEVEFLGHPDAELSRTPGLSGRAGRAHPALPAAVAVNLGSMTALPAPSGGWMGDVGRGGGRRKPPLPWSPGRPPGPGGVPLWRGRARHLGRYPTTFEQKLAAVACHRNQVEKTPRLGRGHPSLQPGLWPAEKLRTLNIQAKGHPLSRIARTISVEETQS